MFKRYKIKQQISHKAGRSTYLADDYETNQQVVIKILEFNDLFDWDTYKLFEREAKTLRSLSHPNIPQFLDYLEINEENCQGFPPGNLYGSALVQTYIDAPSLAEVIEQEIHFSEIEVMELVKKLLGILDYIHGLNPPIIHRDIKPSNILLTNRSGNSIGDVYLVDFGSVQTVAKKEAGTITIVGSYGYIPLEQFMGQTTFASDIYALGMTIVYLVTGIHPAELTQATGKVKFDTSNLSANFVHWLTKATEPYLEERYKSAVSALAALSANASDAFVSREPINLQPKSKYTKLKVRRDRQKLEIIFLESVKTSLSPWIYWVIIPIIVALFMSGIGVLVVIILLLAYSTLDVPSLLYKKHEFRKILITKQRCVSSRLFNYTTAKREKDWEKLSFEDLLYLTLSPSQFDKIEKIVFSPRRLYDKHIFIEDNLIENINIISKAKLSIITDRHELTLAEDSSQEGKIEESELLCLAQEISGFLNIELQFYPQT
ncbi:MAG: serine/threonine-protein kinase [Cyanobacteria bacterium J06588_4]